MTLIQRFTPDAVRARVNSATEAAAMGAFALSFPLAGFIINVVGVRGAYALAALGCVLAAGILVPTMRAAARQPVCDRARPQRGRARGAVSES